MERGTHPHTRTHTFSFSLSLSRVPLLFYEGRKRNGWREIMRVLPGERCARQNYNLGDVIPSRRNGLHIPRGGRRKRKRGRRQGASRQGVGGGRDLSTARSALTRRRKLERYCISEAMIAPRRLALNCIRPLQEFSRHYRTPRLSPLPALRTDTSRAFLPHTTKDVGAGGGRRQVFRWMSVAKY